MPRIRIVLQALTARMQAERGVLSVDVLSWLTVCVKDRLEKYLAW